MSRTNTKARKRQLRVRARMTGTKERPRLSVHKTSKYIYAQVINDEKGETIVSVSGSHIKKTKEQTKTEIAKLLGAEVAKKAVSKKIKKVVFDRGSFRYHGRVKAFADAAREGGLDF